MLINELPDDCLLAIFDHLSDLKDLLNCCKVCLKWSQLIAVRAKKVKYFIEHPDYSADYVFYEDRDMIDLVGLSTLFPNLIIAELTDEFQGKVKFEDIVAFVRNHESLKGIIIYSAEAVETCGDKLEMLAMLECSEPRILRNCSSMKQLRTFAYYTLDDLKEDAQYLPNLERLQIILNGSYLNGQVLEKLKVVEMSSNVFNLGTIFYGFQFMDSCPNLQSAHITMISKTVLVDETLKHECLQDLVIHFYYNDRIWNDLKRTLLKYPNLKHLSLRTPEQIADRHIKQLVHLLPSLVIFDVSRCDGVTQKAADYVANYCKRNERSTKFYFNGNCHEIKSDWPQLSTKRERISRGFDFMKHCFLKDFYDLSYFLVPIDY